MRRTCPSCSHMRMGLNNSSERWQAVEDLTAHRVRESRKYTHQFDRSAWGALAHRGIQGGKYPTNSLRLYPKVGRATYDQLQWIGMTIDPSTGNTIYPRPATFDIRNPPGYFHTEITRKMNGEIELEDWNPYQHTSTRNIFIRGLGMRPRPQHCRAPVGSCLGASSRGFSADWKERKETVLQLRFPHGVCN